MKKYTAKNSLLNKINKFVIPAQAGISILLLFISIQSHAQKEDYNWIFGANDNGRNVFNFENEVLNIDTNSSDMNFYNANTALSDSLGNLLFYSNGLRVYDGQTHQLIENGDSLSFGWYWTNSFNLSNASRIPNSIMSLKDLKEPDTYNIFHFIRDTIFPDSSSFLFGSADTAILQTKIKDNNGQLEIVFKNKPVLKDTLTDGGMSACRHANGRDWWIVCQEAFTNCVNVMLYTPDTLYLHHKDCFGFENLYLALEISKFTNNGNTYIYANGVFGLKIFDFDRCSGELSFKEHIPRGALMEPNDFIGNYFGHFAISPNSQYLYTGPVDSLFRFDLEASNIIGSQLLVRGVHPDSVNTPTFIPTALGVDGKIYGNLGNFPYYNVMNNPNETNVANIVFDFLVPLLKKGSQSFGNFPNYRLGRLIGSPCDTLIDTTIAIRELTELNVLDAYPNPAQTKIRIDYAGKFWERVSNLKLEVTDVLSRTYYNKSLPEYSAFQILDIADYPKGVYFVYLKDEGKVLGTLKFVKR